MELTKQQAQKNLKIYGRISFFSWVSFLIPIISIFYKYTWLSTAEIVLMSNIFTLWMWIFELPTSVLADTMWRKKSLVASVVSNFLCAAFILFFPNLIGFAIAAVFQWLYYSFWSWTWQAFLEENLSKIWKREKFWKFFWNFSFYEELAAVFTPLIASAILKWQPDTWYTILAALDVIFAWWLVVLTLQLTETTQMKHKFTSFKHIVKVNVDTWISALKDVFRDSKLKNFLVYRCLTHHVKYFWILLLPILAEKGMVDWVSWLLTTIFTLWSMFASKYAYKIWEKYWYQSSFICSTVVQGIFLVIAGLFFNSWIFLFVIYFFFSIFDGFVFVSRNHCLVQLTQWKSLATCRSIIFACVSLYMTIMRRILSYFDTNISLIIIWVIVLIFNIILAKKFAIMFKGIDK
jgi:MFS family permease